MSARIIILLTFFITATARANVCDQAPDLLEEIIKRGEIRVGWISAKPFQYIDENGNLTGAFINAGNMLANRLLIVKITWVEARWDTFIAGLQSGKFDIVISNVARRPSRALSV
jgi:cystine transport system substrate-binding protein